MINTCFLFGMDKVATSITILPGGSVFVVGEKGYCATFAAPDIWKEEFNNRICKEEPLVHRRISERRDEEYARITQERNG